MSLFLSKDTCFRLTSRWSLTEVQTGSLNPPLYLVQELAVDLHFFYPSISEATARTAALVCLTSHYSQAIAIRTVQVMASRRPRGPGLGTVLSFMVSVLLGKVTKAKLEVHEGRHEALVIALCRAMYRIASPGEASADSHSKLPVR